MTLYGCIEAGGTKFILGVASDPDTILRATRVPTTTPAETLGATLAFFDHARAELGAFAAFGIASFGPVVLDRDDPLWSHIAATPKPGWSGTVPPALGDRSGLLGALALAQGARR